LLNPAIIGKFNVQNNLKDKTMSANKHNKRMRWQKWLLSICLSFYPPAFYSQVLNGSFEIDGQPTLAYWHIPCVLSESYKDAPITGGSWCLKVSSASYMGCILARAYQIIPDIQTGEIWRLSAWVRRDYSFPTSSIYFRIEHPTGLPTILSKDTTTSNTWTYLTTVDTFVLLPGDEVFVTLDAGSGSGPMLLWSYFDLITVEKIGVLDAYSQDDEFTPSTVKLFQNYPNPFNSVTKISYQLPQPIFINITVFDIHGHLVETLVDGNNNAGLHTIEWNAGNVSSGLYFYRLKTSNYTETKKCLILN
jgi:hypothetical protein